MDFFWMLGQVPVATAFGVATLGIQSALFRLLPSTVAEGTANGAVTAWVAMNLLWMLGDEYERPALIHSAAAVFGVSLILLALAVWKGGLAGPALQRFRRFRIGKRT